MREEKQEITLDKRAIDLNIPYIASMEITTRCNFNCVHCYLPEHSKEMKTEEAMDIISQLKELGIFELTLTGGEIFLHKDIIDIIRFAREQGIRVTLFTNVSLLNEERIRILADLYVTEVSTTLFSLNDDINDIITCHRNSAKNVIKNVLLLKKYGISVEIKVPIMKQNLREYELIRDFCIKNDIKFNYSIAISSRNDGNRKPCEYRLRQSEINGVIATLEKEKTISGYNPADYICTAPHNSLHIDVDGNVYPCISFLMKYGNVKQQSLKELWYTSSERAYLTSLRKSDMVKCGQCELREKCIKCPGLALSEQKNLFACSEIDKSIAIAKL